MRQIGTDIDFAASLLNNGELVVIPTETVYGLAANAFDPKAVEKIYALKKRPKTNPLILHISSMEEAHKYVNDIPEVAQRLMNHFWPGPLTVLLEKSSIVPDTITAGSKKVALRVPRKEITLELLRKIDFPLVAPSANPFTYISPTRPEHLLYCYGANTPYILDGGACEEGIESTIVGFENNEVVVYRVGAITVEEIEKISGCSTRLFAKNEDAEVTPGMHHKHYSPRTKVLLASIEEIKKMENENRGWITFSERIERPNSFFLGESGLKLAASQLYDTLYKMDEMNLTQIVIERIPETELGRSIMDRLKRSANQ